MMQPNRIDPAEFASLMAGFQPFEPAPHVAVAVSGGADSMALCLLAADWAGARGGTVTALTVDHGLRAESAAEAAETGRRLAARGIRHEVLTWTGDKPVRGIQAAARQARYGLLNGWCRKAGVLHLLLAHHADDQAETMLMRMQRGSGPDGLAAMAPVRELSDCRLLRPLLGVPKGRLRATLDAQGMAFADDPSNHNPAFARVRLRRALADAGLEVASLAAGSARFAAARAALEGAAAAWLARGAKLSPFGFATLDAKALFGAPLEIQHRVLARTAASIGGGAFPPAIAATERLARTLAAGTSSALGRTRFIVRRGTIGVFREARGLPAPMPLGAGIAWDGRFWIAPDAAVSAPAEVRAWSPEIAAAWPMDARPKWLRPLPAAALIGLPVIETGGDFAVPQPAREVSGGFSMHFQPRIPLSGMGFAVA